MIFQWRTEDHLGCGAIAGRLNVDPDAPHILPLLHRPARRRVHLLHLPPNRHRDPDHPRRLSVREEPLIEILREFLNTRIFGPDRAALLAEQWSAPSHHGCGGNADAVEQSAWPASTKASPVYESAVIHSATMRITNACHS